MSGFDNDVMYANNVDFTGGGTVSGRVTTDGQLLIGSTASPNIRVGTLTQPAAGVTITGGAGSITFALADDLAAVEGLASTGLATRTAASTWTTRTVTGTTDQITVTNGNGVSGNPTLSFPTTFLANGTWTPVIEGTGTAGTGTYTIQVGRYQRVNKTVWVFGRAVWSAHTGTGDMQMSGLPFNTSSASNATQFFPFSTARATATPFTNAYVWGITLSNQAVIRPVSFNNGTGGVVQQAITGTGEFIFQGVYEIN